MRPINLSHKKGWLFLREAAKKAGVSKKTLFRAYAYGQLVLRKGNRSGRWWVRWSAVRNAPLITAGRAAKRIGVHYETVRRWLKANAIQASQWLPPSSGIRAARRLSLSEIDRIKKERR